LAASNYGNYQYSDGSLMVWIPAFYYKWGTGSNGLAINAVGIKPYSAYVDVATANTDGYALHRAFYDGGVRDGFFMDKYLCSNSLGANVSGGIFSSLKNGIPCDTDGSQSGVSAISGVGTNNLGSVQQAAKSRGTIFHGASIFMNGALAILSYAHAQASTSTTYCAWYDTIYNFPKGCNSNTLSDANDATLTFVTAGHGTYPYKPLTGSANNLAKTTHNGQASGVADVNGTLTKVAFGLTSDGTNYYALKTTKRMRDLTGSNATGADSFFGATGIAANYDSLGATVGVIGSGGTVTYFGSASQVFDAATSGTMWQATGAGIPIADGGTNAFGSDRIYDAKPNNMCPAVGGGFTAGTLSGVWNFYFGDAYTFSYYGFGGRAAAYL